MSLRASLLALALASGAAAFAATRSDALAEAQRLYQRARDPASLAHVHRLAREHLQRQPWNHEAARLAAITLSQLDYPDQAEPYYKRAQPLDLADSLTRAHAITRSNQREQAISAYEQILKQWPDDPLALRMLGGLHFSRRAYSEALAIARRLQKIPEQASEGHRLEASIQHDARDPEAAVAHFSRVLELDPALKRVPADTHAIFWFSFVTDLLSLGRAQTALDWLSSQPEGTLNPALRTLLGQAQRQLGQGQAAEATWLAVVRDDPRLGAAWLELGKLWLARGQVDQAVSALEAARAVAPTEDEILYPLMLAYRRADRLTDAQATERALNQVRTEKPPKPSGMGSREPL